MTLPEIARHAYYAKQVDGCNGEVADAVLLAVVQELIKEATSNQHRNPRCWLEEIHAVVSALLGVRRDEQGLEKNKALSRSDQPQLRAGEADLRDDHRGRP